MPPLAACAASESMSRKVLITLQFKAPFTPREDVCLKFTQWSTLPHFIEHTHGITQSPARVKITFWDGHAQMSCEDIYGAMEHYLRTGEENLPFDDVTYAADKAVVGLQVSYQPKANHCGQYPRKGKAVVSTLKRNIVS